MIERNSSSSVRHVGRHPSFEWRIMVSMGRKGFAVVLLTTALGVAACGTESAGGTATPTPVSAPGAVPERGFGGGSVGDSTDPISGPTFPLTLRRTGGIAGFDDTVVLEASGKVLVNTRSIHGRVCMLSGSQRRQLLNLLGTLALSGPPTATADRAPSDTPGAGDGSSDPIVISLTDHNAHPVDLSDPSLGEVAGLVGSLVTDVTLSSPATTNCTTPTSPVPAPPS